MRELFQHFLNLFSHSRAKRALFLGAVFSLCGTCWVFGYQRFWVEQRFSAAI